MGVPPMRLEGVSPRGSRKDNHMQHLGTKKLETERLILRPFTLDDAEPMFRNWAGDSDITKYLSWKPHGSVEDTKTRLEQWIQSYAKQEYYHWAIVLKEISEPIGGVAVGQQSDVTQMVHLGYSIGKPWWNKGIMTEALHALIAFFFREVGVNRIEARHDPRNAGSGRVMVKCGMKYEGLIRQADKNNQGICDCVMYGILAEDYFGSNAENV